MVFMSDLRYAFRRLLAAPGFTAVAVMTLALGIGATTAIYSVVDMMMLRPLPYPDPERLVFLGSRGEDNRTSVYFAPDQLRQLKDRTDLFASVDGFNFATGTLLGGDEPVLATGAVVGGTLMQTLGVQPALGRMIEEADVQPGRDNVVVLSDNAWRQRFGADPGIIGRSIRLDNRAVEVIGVMPPSFDFPGGRRQYWTPYVLSAAEAARRPFFIVGRLHSNRPIDQARAHIAATSIEARASSGAASTRRLTVEPPLARRTNTDVRTAIYLLSGAVTLVLLIACANIANLLLVQNAARDREIAVRAAIGASRARLVRQFLTEAVLLACIGGMMGLVVAQWAIELLIAMSPPDLARYGVPDIALDRRIITFALAATTLTAGLFGLIPAMRSSRRQPQDALKAGARTATDAPGQERLRRVFVVLQLAVSVILLVGASLLTRTFVRLIQTSPGFDARTLAAVTLDLPRWKYPSPQARRDFYDALVARVRAQPGVAAATVSGGAPPGGGGVHFGLKFELEGRGVVLDDAKIMLPFNAVEPEFFTVTGIPIKAGRSFTTDDVRGAPLAIIVSEAMAEAIWKGANPVGQRLRLDTDPQDPWYTVVGVAGNIYQFDYANTRGQFACYYPVAQYGVSSTQSLIARAEDPAAILPLLREQIRALDPEQSIWKLETTRMQYGEFVALPRFYTFVITMFAALGVTIAAVGLYGVLAYAIAQRTREFGIRIALGAQTSDVLGLVLRNGGLVTGAGLALGLAGSVVVSRFFASMLIDTPRLDPLSYAAVTVLLCAVALAACLIPARRATRVDPIVALRCE
jgi:putative ABC transport system permease protein